MLYNPILLQHTLQLTNGILYILQQSPIILQCVPLYSTHIHCILTISGKSNVLCIQVYTGMCIVYKILLQHLPTLLQYNHTLIFPSLDTDATTRCPLMLLISKFPGKLRLSCMKENKFITELFIHPKDVNIKALTPTDSFRVDNELNRVGLSSDCTLALHKRFFGNPFYSK